MKIDTNTLYSEFQPFEDCLQDGERDRLKKWAETTLCDMYTLTFDEFFGLLDGDFQLLGDMTAPRVVQVFWLYRFRDFCNEFSAAGKRLSLKPTAEQVQSQAGTLDMTTREAVLIFCRDYFALHSFTDAGKITLGEYLLARKDRYNNAVMERNYLAAQKRHLKSRKK